MRKCVNPECGAETPESYAACPKCGWTLLEVKTKEKEKKPADDKQH